MRSTEFVSPISAEGATNGALRQAQLEHHLANVLRLGGVMVTVNLSSHRGDQIVAAIEAGRAEVRYLPPYSPDLTAI